MTPEQIIQMARDAGIDEWWDSGGDWRETFDEVLERFASAIRAATKEEDAKICDESTKEWLSLNEPQFAASAYQLSKEIRATK